MTSHSLPPCRLHLGLVSTGGVRLAAVGADSEAVVEICLADVSTTFADFISSHPPQWSLSALEASFELKKSLSRQLRWRRSKGGQGRIRDK